MDKNDFDIDFDFDSTKIEMPDILNEKEKEMLKLYYLDNKPINFIADELGYSEAGIKKMHKRALKKIESLL